MKAQEFKTKAEAIKFLEANCSDNFFIGLAIRRSKKVNSKAMRDEAKSKARTAKEKKVVPVKPEVKK